MKARFLTLKEINEYTHTSVIYLKRLIKNGTIRATKRATKISKEYLVSEYKYYKFLELMEVKPNGK